MSLTDALVAPAHYSQSYLRQLGGLLPRPDLGIVGLSQVPFQTQILAHFNVVGEGFEEYSWPAKWLSCCLTRLGRTNLGAFVCLTPRISVL